MNRSKFFNHASPLVPAAASKVSKRWAYMENGQPRAFSGALEKPEGDAWVWFSDDPVAVKPPPPAQLPVTPVDYTKPEPAAPAPWPTAETYAGDIMVTVPFRLLREVCDNAEGDSYAAEQEAAVTDDDRSDFHAERNLILLLRSYLETGRQPE
jgi:hypothetical protein